MRIPFIALLMIFFSAIIHAQTTFPHDGIKSKKTVYTWIKGATVHKSPGKTEVTDLVIYKNKIVFAGDIKDFSFPENAVEIDLTGYHIYPSFIEFNSEYGIEKAPKKPSSRGPSPDRQVNQATYWNEAIHPELVSATLFQPDTSATRAMAAKGFGVALVHRQDGIARGTSTLVMTGGGLANEQVVEAEVAAHFSFQKGNSSQDYPSSLMGAMALLRQALYDAAWYAQSEKPETNYSLEAFSRQASMPQIFDASDKYDLVRIARIAKEFEKKFIVTAPGDVYQVLGQIGDEIEALVVSLDFPKPYDVSDPDLNRYISQADMLHFERAPFNPFFIQEKEIPLILSGQGISKSEDFFSALLKSINAGLDRDTALAALTTTPARLMGAGQKVGKIEKGYLANFFVTRKDPFLETEASIVSHWINGEEIVLKDRNAIDLKGKYDLNVNDTYHTLTITGEKGKYKGNMYQINGNDTVKTKANVSLMGHEISLTYGYENDGGSYRLSATSNSKNRIWTGQGFDPSGKQVQWSAIRIVDKKTNGNKSENEKTDSIQAPPNMLYPMVAYGFDSIPKAETLLIENATLWTNSAAGIIQKGHILIYDGKILHVGAAINPADFLPKKSLESLARIDAKGKHITPGIIDEHSHIAITRGVNEGTQASTAEVRIQDALNPDDINIYRQLSGGVTTSQLLHGSANPIGGQSAIIKLRWGKGYEDLIFAEAPGFIKFALGENVKQSNWGDHQRSRYPQTRMGVEQFFYDYFYRAKEYGDEKKLVDSRQEMKPREKKKAPAPDPFRRDIELDALLEILENERFITCHSYVQSEINMLMHLADSMGFKINTFTHILEGYKVADKMQKHGAAGSTFSDWWAYKYEVKDAIPYNAAIMHENGVLTAINSDDAEMARRLNQEAAKGIKYGGMSEEDALKMVTLNPAKMLHIDAYVGSLEAGKHADIVIWSGHPLSVYSKADMTFVDGIRYFDRAAMAALQERDQAERARIANLMQAEKDNGTKAKKPERKAEMHYHCDSE
jgi:imidazolonepropionase-like amidohydrolase